jgi:hypothetical protein
MHRTVQQVRFERQTQSVRSTARRYLFRFGEARWVELPRELEFNVIVRHEAHSSVHRGGSMKRAWTSRTLAFALAQALLVISCGEDPAPAPNTDDRDEVRKDAARSTSSTMRPSTSSLRSFSP